MWRSKKFILVTILAALVLVGSIGGVVFANEGENEDGSPTEAKYEALLGRVCEIYNANPDTSCDIDCEVLKAAFIEAGTEMRAATIENRLAKMIENGVIDETQAKELQDWWESRPEMPGRFGFAGRGFHGKGGMRGFGGSCYPIE